MKPILKTYLITILKPSLTYSRRHQKLAILIVIFVSMTLCACQKGSQQANIDAQNLAEQHKAQMLEMQSQIDQQNLRVERWQLVSLTLGAGCLVLLVLGTALGAKTRHDWSSSQATSYTADSVTPLSRQRSQTSKHVEPS